MRKTEPVLVEILILMANLGVLGLTVKLYTEFIKEMKYRRMGKED